MKNQTQNNILSILLGLFIVLPIITSTVRDSLYNADVMKWGEAIDFSNNIWLLASVLIIGIFILIARTKPN